MSRRQLGCRHFCLDEIIRDDCVTILKKSLTRVMLQGTDLVCLLKFCIGSIGRHLHQYLAWIRSAARGVGTYTKDVVVLGILRHIVGLEEDV